MAIPILSLQAPLNVAPVAADGQFNYAWSRHHQDITDQLNQLQQTVVAGLGVTDGTEAGAGAVGQYMESVVAPAGVGMVTGVAVNVTSMVLTPGDWDVTGTASFQPDPTTHPLQIEVGVGSVSGAFGPYRTQIPAVFSFPSFLAAGAGPVRFNTAAPLTVFLVAFAVFTTAGMHASGVLRARRMR